MNVVKSRRPKRLRRTKAQLVEELERLEARLAAFESGAEQSRAGAASEEEARFRRAVENLAEGLAFYDSDDRLIFCNEEYRRVHPLIRDLLVPGAPFEDMVRAHAERGAIPEAVGREEEYVRERLTQHRSPADPILRELVDGTWFIIQEGRTPDGGIYSITTDVTRLKKSEEELRASQAQFLSAVEALQEGFALYDADDRLVVCNDEYKRLHPKVEDILKPGMPFEDLVRANIEQGMNADAIGCEEEHIRDRLARHRDPKEPIVRTLTDGSCFVIKESLTADGGVVVTETDITGRRRAEEARERLSQAMENVPVGIALFDSDDRLVFCNSRYRALMDVMADVVEPGVSFEEMVRTIVARAPVKDARGREEEYIQERLARHRNPSGPVDLRREGKWLQANETRMPDGSIFVIITDITEQKRAEEALVQSGERLSGAIESLQEGFALFDADDRLVAINDRYRRVNPAAQEVLERGGTFEDLIRANMERGVLVEAIGREEEFLAERLERHRDPGEPIIRRMTDGHWYMLSEARTPEGGIALSFIDITELKRAEEALRESHQRFKDYAQVASDWFWEMDEQLRFTYFSGRNHQLTGYKPEDVIGKTRREMAKGDTDDPRWQQHFADLEAHRPFQDFRYPLVAADGGTMYISVSGKPVFGADGSFKGYRGTGTDITERKRVEELLRDAVESIPEGFALYDSDDRLVLFNKNFLKDRPGLEKVLKVGMTFEEQSRLREKLGLRAKHGGTSAIPLEKRIELHRNPKGPYEAEMPDGRTLQVDEFQTRAGGIAIIRTDITEQKKAKEALRESEERFRNLVEGSIQGIVIHRDHKPLFVNKAYAEIFGYDDPVEILELDTVLELFAPHERERIVRYREARNRGEDVPTTYEVQGLRRDGAMLWLENRVRVVNWRGEPAIQTTVIDITVRKQAEILEKSRTMVLEKLAVGAPLDEVLSFLAMTVEAIRRDMVCSVLVADKDGKRLRHCAAPSLPTYFNKAVDGIEIAPGVGCCGTAAATGKTVIVRDIATHPDWELLRGVAKRAGLRACWSQPIFSTAGEVLGTFGLYYREPREPDTADLDIINSATNLAGIAIERKHAEEALKESEGRFRDVAESAGDWIWEMGPDLRFTYLSGRFYELFPVKPSEIIGKTRDEFAGAGRGDHQWRRHLSDIANHEPFRNFEYSVTLADGQTKHIRISGKPLFDAQGTFTGYRGTGTDVTGEVEARAAAEKAEARLFDAVESITAGLALFDRDDRLVLYNSRYKDLHPVLAEVAQAGATFEEIISGMAQAGVYDDAMGSPEAYVRKRMELHRNAPVRHEQRLADGRVIDIHEYNTHDGGTVLLWTDTTERRLLERQLAGSQRMEALGKLTGGVAHDFNNLLTVILGNLQLMERRIDDDERLEKYVSLASGAAERGAELTTRLLAFARRQMLEATVFDVNGLVGGIEELLRGTLGETIRLEKRLDADAWPVRADPTQLENALLNLALNARDAMPQGGRMTIETGNVVFDDAYVLQNPGAQPGDYVMVAIGDSGVGMEPEVLDHALEPFFTTKETGKGTGLGLSMVYGFVKQSGGYVKLYSEPGEGTVVKLYLPSPHRDERAAEAGAPADREIVGGDETILVVEDDADVRRTTVALLDELGYRVVEAEDGPSALSVLEQHAEIDLLFTDVVMPGGMKGPELADEVARRRPEVGVLYMSGYTEYGVLSDGMIDMSGMLLSKPFQKAELADKVRRALDGRQGATP